MEKLFPILTMSTCGTSLGMSWWCDSAKRKTSYSWDSVGNNPPVEQENNRELLSEATHGQLHMHKKKRTAAYLSPFSPILMLLGKLALEPKHIPSKLV